MRPRLLDLYCGAGGAAAGYHLAGFDVVGVDHRPQPRYPFTFIEADALAALAQPGFLDRFDAVHASPPCKAHSQMRYGAWSDHVDLLAPTREALRAGGLPWVIENVEGAPLYHPIRLCGSAFGLGARGRQLRRHRLFESNVAMHGTRCAHEGEAVGVYGTGGWSRPRPGYGRGGYQGTPAERREALGIDWMTVAELAQAIPPAYTQFVGGFLMAALRGAPVPA